MLRISFTESGNIPIVVKLLCHFKRFLFRRVYPKLVSMTRSVGSFGGVYRELKSNVYVKTRLNRVQNDAKTGLADNVLSSVSYRNVDQRSVSSSAPFARQ